VTTEPIGAPNPPIAKLTDEDGSTLELDRAPGIYGVQLWCPARLVWAEIDDARAFAFSLLGLCDSLELERISHVEPEAST
jgi:hypothetical protein